MRRLRGATDDDAAVMRATCRLAANLSHSGDHSESRPGHIGSGGT
jgi:hypothetical protein